MVINVKLLSSTDRSYRLQDTLFPILKKVTWHSSDSIHLVMGGSSHWGTVCPPRCVHTFGQRYAYQSMGKDVWTPSSFFQSHFQPQTHSWGYGPWHSLSSSVLAKQLLTLTHTNTNFPPLLLIAELNNRNACLFMTLLKKEKSKILLQTLKKNAGTAWGVVWIFGGEAHTLMCMCVCMCVCVCECVCV